LPPLPGVADFKSESLADVIPESAADFARNTQAAATAVRSRLQRRPLCGRKSPYSRNGQFAAGASKMTGLGGHTERGSVRPPALLNLGRPQP
jgi:hypothetical protein